MVRAGAQLKLQQGLRRSWFTEPSKWCHCSLNSSVIATGGIPQLFQQLHKAVGVTSILLHQLPLYENGVCARLPCLACIFHAAHGHGDGVGEGAVGL